MEQPKLSNAPAQTKKRAWRNVFGNMKVQQTLTICAFLAIPLVLLFLFTYLPLGDMIRYSLFRWDGYSDMEFIGLDNYKTLFSDPQYFSVLKTSIYYFIGSLVQIAVALYFATMFFYKLRGKNFFKGVIFFPYLLNGVAIGFVFRIIMPLLKPAIVTVIIIKGIGFYNEFYTPYLYMKDKSLQVISTSLYAFQGPYGTQWEVICAACIITMLPTLIVFLLLQKHIYSGLTMGAVKG